MVYLTLSFFCLFRFPHSKHCRSWNPWNGSGISLHLSPNQRRLLLYSPGLFHCWWPMMCKLSSEICLLACLLSLILFQSTSILLIFPVLITQKRVEKNIWRYLLLACKIFVPVASNRAVAWDFILRVKIHTRSPVAPGIHPTFSMWTMLLSRKSDYIWLLIIR